MEKLKKIFSNISLAFKDIYRTYPLTIIVVYITTLIYAFGTTHFLNEFNKNDGLMVMIVWAIGMFFVENCFSKKSFKIIGGIASLGISIFFREAIDANATNDFLQRCFITYVMVLPLLTLYKLIIDSKIELKEYASTVISNFGKCSTIYVIANLGILLVLAVFVELILDGHDWDIYEKVLILLLGGYYVPSLINAISNIETPAGKFLKVLVTYVLTPVVTVLIGILYLYLIKITIIGELLHNSIFFILSLTFAVTIPVSLLLKNYDENPKIKKVSTALIFLFIPFIFLQIFAMGIRVKEYGLTASRYMAFFLIAFEIVFISLMLIKKSQHLDKSILFVVALVFLGVLSPLNIEAVPAMSQASRIEKMLSGSGNFENLTVDEKEECKRAYTFLRRNKNEEYLDKISEEEINKIKNYESVKQTELEYAETRYISEYTNIDGLDISEYSKIYELYDGYYSYNEKNYNSYAVFDKYKFIEEKINLQKLMKLLIKADEEKNSEEVFLNNNLIDTENENVKVYLTNISFSYEIYTKEPNYVNMNGFILVK